ncbi:MAG: Gfo/Idh/MocA family oxidoreductase [Gloeobacteraceae cyanobacterium ES-bin-144]|nr:Gfo/Idh/MocA family oxidoreductase [Verrucomicrobiales bacterium]
MNPASSRRRFIQSSTAAGIGLATFGLPRARAASANGKLRVLSIGVVGTIGASDRKAVASHADAEIVGLCDVDSNYLSIAAKEHPNAFTCKDYREAFAKHSDKFDAVIVSVPDHSHAPILLTAMAHDKHVYGQKPLVHQLAELTMVEDALKAKPNLITQLGNQRMAFAGRRAAIDILRRGELGKAIEAFCWTGSPNDNHYFNYKKVYKENPVIPANLDYDLWLGPCAKMPYYDELAPAKWRSWWNFGTNGLGDWGCHLLDVIFFSYDDLISPFAVKTECAEPAGEIFHVNPCKSTIRYKVSSNTFSSDTFPIHFYDSNQIPSPEQLRITQPIKNDNMTAVVCEGGTLTLEADGRLKIWRNGKMEEGLRLPGLPKYPTLNHWHAWVDNCLGKKTELRAPFKDAVRITEACLLAVKATRFPNQELLWDKSKLAFTNNSEATRTIVSCQYREGFGPPKVG